MTSKFTPGPWLSKPAFYDDGFVVLGTPAAHRKRLDANGSFQEADAQLIAAAPDLHQNLKALIARIDDDLEAASFLVDAGCIECTVGTVPNDLNTGLCPYHGGKAALAKAEGRS